METENMDPSITGRLSTESCGVSIYELALSGDVLAIRSILGSDNDRNEENVLKNVLWEKDEIGRNALFAASMLGRSDVIRELVKHGAEVNSWTVKGMLIFFSSFSFLSFFIFYFFTENYSDYARLCCN